MAQFEFVVQGRGIAALQFAGKLAFGWRSASSAAIKSVFLLFSASCFISRGGCVFSNLRYHPEIAGNL
jgi:hypothetical protein